MKKKLTAIALIVALLAVAVIGGTLAYFTDTDAEENTFTIGNVSIDLKENFDEENANLNPGPENSIQKEVWIENDGTEDAYVWYEWLIPSVLDCPENASYNFVHVNSYGRTWDKYRQNTAYWAEGQTEALPEKQTWDHTTEGTDGYLGQEEVGGVVYNKYVVLYHGVIAKGEGTTPAMSKVYLDKNVDCDGEYYVWETRGCDPKKIPMDQIDEFDIIVRAYGIQAEGFDDVYAAYDAFQAQAK